MNLSLCFSPCPNDTFIFDALVHKRISNPSIDFRIQLEDVEELNKNVIAGKPDISKLSFNAYTKVYHDYVMLDSGAALGFGVGPLLVCREGLSLEKALSGIVAIPGINTTAAFLLSFIFGNRIRLRSILFSEIENAVLSGTVDAGVIIHENRFTYHDKGLICLADLGSLWESKTSLPVPLGGIVAKRSLGHKTISKISGLIASSLLHAWNNPDDSLPFIREYAQEMDESVMRKHIALYVNEYSLSLGTNGRKALSMLFDTHNINASPLDLVLP